MIKRAAFEIVKGFDQRFFMYSEDLDLCHRVRRAGLDCLYEPGAKITHHGGGSSSSARSMFSVLMTRESVCRFFKFNYGPFAALGYRMAMGLCALVRLPLVLGVWLVKKITGRPATFNSVNKWRAILRWSVGLESWTAKKTGAADNQLAKSLFPENSSAELAAQKPSVKPSCAA